MSESKDICRWLRAAEDEHGSPFMGEAADLIERQDRALREISGLLKDLDLGRSIHNSRFPGQPIDGPLWAQIPRVLETARALTKQ